MLPSHDAPLTSGQRFVLLVLTLFFPPLLFVWALAFFWFRDTSPRRARSIAWVGLTFLQGLVLVILTVGLVQFVGGVVARF